MILYNAKGRIVEEGVFQENETHYFKDDVYFDKKTCFLFNGDTPVNFEKSEFVIRDGVVEKKYKNIYTKNQIRDIMGSDIVNIDNYEWWIVNNLPEENQQLIILTMTSLTKNFEAQTYINTEDPQYILYLDKLLEIGFINQAKYDEMSELGGV